MCREAERLWTAFPNTREHLEVRKMDMEEQLKDILEGTRRHHERLQHMESLQAYFQVRTYSGPAVMIEEYLRFRSIAS